METTQEVYTRIRPLIEQNLPDQLEDFDAFAPAVIDAELNPKSAEAELGITDLLSPQNIASYLVIVQSVVHLIKIYGKTKQTPDNSAKEEANTHDKLKDKVSDNVISELITIAKQVSNIK